jgi:hypothetical protein
MPRDEAASGNTLRGARMTASGKVAPRHFERLDRSLWADTSPNSLSLTDLPAI